MLAGARAYFPAQQLHAPTPPEVSLGLPGARSGESRADRAEERFSMPKGQEKPQKTLNKPKLTIKEKKQKKKDKAATKG